MDIPNDLFKAVERIKRVLGDEIKITLVGEFRPDRNLSNRIDIIKVKDTDFITKLFYINVRLDNIAIKFDYDNYLKCDLDQEGLIHLDTITKISKIFNFNADLLLKEYLRIIKSVLPTTSGEITLPYTVNNELPIQAIKQIVDYAMDISNQILA